MEKAHPILEARINSVVADYNKAALMDSVRGKNTIYHDMILTGADRRLKFMLRSIKTADELAILEGRLAEITDPIIRKRASAFKDEKREKLAKETEPGVVKDPSRKKIWATSAVCTVSTAWTGISLYLAVSNLKTSIAILATGAFSFATGAKSGYSVFKLLKRGKGEQEQKNP